MMNATTTAPPDAPRLLATYLRDHCAAATAGRALVARCRESNESSEWGDVLAGLESEVVEDLESLRSVMGRLDVGESRVKSALARAGEVAGRLKPNRRVRQYSPLSRVVELEALMAGVTAKRALWTALGTVAGSHPGLERQEFDRLVQRAEDQRTVLEAAHVRATTAAFEQQPH